MFDSTGSALPDRERERLYASFLSFLFLYALDFVFYIRGQRCLLYVFGYIYCKCNRVLTVSIYYIFLIQVYDN